MEENYLSNKRINQKLAMIIFLAISVFLTACSSSFERGDALIAADEMKEGPGIFSGQQGAFYLVGGKQKASTSKPVNKMSVEETSIAIDKKIEQLENDRKDLEQLKRQLNRS